MTDTHGTPSSPPASTPADGGAAPASPAADSALDNTSDLMNLGGFDDDLETVTVVENPPAGEGGEGTTPASPPSPTPAAPDAKTAAAPASPTPPASDGGPKEPQTPAPQGAAPASSPSEPQSFVEQLDANRQAMIDSLAQDVFKLSKEETDALELDVIGTAPKLLARVYYESVRATINHIQNFVPRLIEQYMQVNKAREETENAFYGKYTGLNKAKHHEDVVKFATTFRQVNPNVTQDELWSLIAASVAAKHGVQLVGAQAAANGGAPPRPPATEPFAPARPGVTVRTTPEAANPYEGMGIDFDEEQ
jgi:hypothetical protein